MPPGKLPYPEDPLPKGLPVEVIPVDRLLLDVENPRLRVPATASQEKVLRELYEEHRLEELMNSLLSNGYFDEEPLVAVPGGRRGTFVVVEGNRRLAALKLLTDDRLAAKMRITGLPDATPAQIERLLNVPVKIYGDRAEVLPYLGFRHITGIKEWDAASKARYVFQLRHNSGLTLKEIGNRIGDTYNTTERLYLGWSLLKQAERELDVDETDFKKFFFSYMYDAVRTPEVREFLQLPPGKFEVSRKNLPNLRELIAWLFGSRSLSQDPAVQTKSQLRRLAYVVSDKKGTTALRRGLTLDDAYQATIGEREDLTASLTKASRELDKAKGVIHRHAKDEEVVELVNRCLSTLSRIRRDISN